LITDGQFAFNCKSLQHAAPEVDVQIVSDADVILQADRVVFPGVGAIRDCMAGSRSIGLSACYPKCCQNETVVGYLLRDAGIIDGQRRKRTTRGLGIVSGHVVHFPDALMDNHGNNLKIPPWLESSDQMPHPLWDKIPQDSRFYFVHSY